MRSLIIITALLCGFTARAQTNLSGNLSNLVAIPWAVNPTNSEDYSHTNLPPWWGGGTNYVNWAGGTNYAHGVNNWMAWQAANHNWRLIAEYVSTNGPVLVAGTNVTIVVNGATNTIRAVLSNTNVVPPDMVVIPAGPFTMGNSITNDADITDADPTNAMVSAFYMDVNLVTWSQWKSVYFWATNHGYTFDNIGAGKAPNHPVQTIDWYDAVKWCNARSQQVGKTPVYYTDAGLTEIYTNAEVTVYANWTVAGYRLPTEAEWEKAARGGVIGQRFPWGNVIDEDLANYHGNTTNYSYDLGPDGWNVIGNGSLTSLGTSPVGSFAANGYGLNDMAGNVYQWCWDFYVLQYAGGTDPRGPTSGSGRMARGGGWDGYAFHCRVADRQDVVDPGYSYGDNLGFRSVLPVVQP